MTLRRICQSKQDLNIAIAPLLAYSFIKRSPTTHSISIHKVVQDVMRDIVEGKMMDVGMVLACLNVRETLPKYWVERAVEALKSSYPDSHDPKSWRVCEVLNSHVSACIEHAQRYHIVTYEMTLLCNAIGTYNQKHGNYVAASKWFEAKLETSKWDLLFEGPGRGKVVANTANAIIALGVAHCNQGKHTEAPAEFHQALKIQEMEFGVDHVQTAFTINNIGNVYQKHGRYDEALAQFERALRIYEEAYGVDNIQNAGFITNIAIAKSNMERNDEALTASLRALKIYESAGLKNDLNMADALNNIGTL
jgi:tetratricopeptide (TPR) repeat protein